MEQKTPEQKDFEIPSLDKPSWHISDKIQNIVMPENKLYSRTPAKVEDTAKVMEIYKKDPIRNPNVSLVNIEVVFNEEQNREFSLALKALQRRKNNPKYDEKWPEHIKDTIPEQKKRNDLFKYFVDISKPYKDPSFPDVHILPLYHATHPDATHYILTDGYAILRRGQTDGGYFGKGVYGTTSPEYAWRVYGREKDNRREVILNWVATYRTFIVLKKDEDNVAEKALGFDEADTHFIGVYSSNHPTASYDAIDPNKNEEVQYYEIVSFLPKSFLSRYILTFLEEKPGNFDIVAKPSTTDDDFELAKSMFNSPLSFVSLINQLEDAQKHGYPEATVRLHWALSGKNGIFPPNSQKLEKMTLLNKEKMEEIQNKTTYDKGSYDPEAMFCIAYSYEYGLGDYPENLKMALQYYWMASQQKHPDAFYHLASFYLVGKYVTKDLNKAIFYYTKACENNPPHPGAMYQLSHLYKPFSEDTQKQKQIATFEKRLIKMEHYKFASQIQKIKDFTKLQNENSQLKNIADKQTSEINNLNQEIQNKASSITKLQTELTKYAHSLSESLGKEENASKNLKEMEKKNKELEEKILQLEQALKAEQAKNENLSRELKDKNNMIDNLKKSTINTLPAPQTTNPLQKELNQPSAPPIKIDNPSPTGEEKEQLSLTLQQIQTLQEEQKFQQMKNETPKFPTHQHTTFYAHNDKIANKGNITQNLLIQAILEGDLNKVKDYLKNGLSLLEPNQEGICPLAAAVEYAANPGLAEYLETQIKNRYDEDTLRNEWKKINYQNAIDKIDSQMPCDPDVYDNKNLTSLPANPTYNDLGNFYINCKDFGWRYNYNIEVQMAYKNFSNQELPWGTRNWTTRGQYVKSKQPEKMPYVPHDNFTITTKKEIGVPSLSAHKEAVKYVRNTVLPEFKNRINQYANSFGYEMKLNNS